MIQVFNNPFLGDFINIAARMPADEKSQIELFTGEKFDVDGAAVGNYTVPGPKWVIKTAASQADFDAGNSTPIAVGGFAPQRPGVWRDFMLTTPEAWEHWFAVTRICRRIMDAMLASDVAHRLECIAPVSRLESRPEILKWYKILGYNKEGLHHGYCANGADAISFARVRH